MVSTSSTAPESAPAAAPAPTDTLSPLRNLRYDIPAGVVVFLVALPLCLGIALASGAPLVSGLLAGVVGGLVIPLISQSPLSVSGPAAGLATIVLAGINQMGDFRIFTMAVFLAGLLQLVLGVARAGLIASFMPSSVIKGMLSAIGLLLILKQFPHAIGYDVEKFGSEAFDAGGGENTFTLALHAVQSLEWGAFIISAVALPILIFWDKTPMRKLPILPAALAAVVSGTLLNELFKVVAPNLALEASHLVALPKEGLFANVQAPLLDALLRKDVWILAITLALVASLETLLSIEAIDKLDPYKRKTNTNRELLAQGAANSISGLLGGLPVTSVIVRSSTNVNAGGRTKAAAFFHGIFLFSAVMLAAPLLMRIPLAALASILLVTGYKLAKPDLFKGMYRLGWNQFIPFVVTILAILFTDLLRGVMIGMVVGVVFMIRSNIRTAYTIRKEGRRIVVVLKHDLYFFNKAALIGVLERIPDGSRVLVDGSACDFIDHDILELLHNFKKAGTLRGVTTELRSIPSPTATAAAH